MSLTEALEQLDDHFESWAYKRVVAAARAVVEGTDIQWCEVHKASVIRTSYVSCGIYAEQSKSQTPHGCRIVSRRLIDVSGLED